MGVGRSSSLRTTTDRSPLHDVRQPAPRDRGSTRYKFLGHGRVVFGEPASGPPSLRRDSLRAPCWLAEPKRPSGAKAGGARRDRTDDLLLAKQALSQLSYGPFRDQGSDVRHQMKRGLIPDTRFLMPGIGGPGKI